MALKCHYKFQQGFLKRTHLKLLIGKMGMSLTEKVNLKG